MSQSESKSKLEKSHPDSVLPKIEEINFETISMIFKDTIRLSMSDVNNEIQKGFAGRNDSSSAKGLRVGVAVFLMTWAYFIRLRKVSCEQFNHHLFYKKYCRVTHAGSHCKYLQSSSIL